jgi:hypothetical protein
MFDRGSKTTLSTSGRRTLNSSYGLKGDKPGYCFGGGFALVDNFTLTPETNISKVPFGPLWKVGPTSGVAST